MNDELLTKYGWTRSKAWGQYITKGNEVIMAEICSKDGRWIRGTYKPPFLGHIENVKFYPSLEDAMKAEDLPLAEEKEERKFCPLRPDDNDSFRECICGKCAWYSEAESECSITLIGSSLSKSERTDLWDE